MSPTTVPLQKESTPAMSCEYGPPNNPGYGPPGYEPPAGSPDTAHVNAVVDTTDAVELENSLQSPRQPSAPPTAPAIPAVKPVNFFLLTREWIYGSFVVDPLMVIPSWLLHPQEHGGPRWNLCLKSHGPGVTPDELDKGTLNVAIHLFHDMERDPMLTRDSRTLLYVGSTNKATAVNPSDLYVSVRTRPQTSSSLPAPCFSNRLCSGPHPARLSGPADTVS